MCGFVFLRDTEKSVLKLELGRVVPGYLNEGRNRRFFGQF
jgi:hypothetical protein